MNNNTNTTTTTSGGITFGGALTVVFIALKLMGVITWSWLWVLSPLWIPFCIAISLLLIFGIFYGLKHLATPTAMKRKK